MGFVLRLLVDWMGRRRGVEASVELSGAYVLFSGALLVAFSLVLGGVVASGSEPVAMIHRGGLAFVLYAAAEADGRWGIIPNELVFTGVVGGVLLQGWTELGVAPFWAGLAVPGVLLLLREGSRWVSGRPGFGLGDIKLGVVLGLFLGWDAFWVLYLAAIAVSLYGMGRVSIAEGDWTHRLPFAPFVALGTGLHWFVLPFEIVRQWMYL